MYVSLKLRFPLCLRKLMPMNTETTVQNKAYDKKKYLYAVLYTYLTKSSLVVFSGNPTRRGLKLEGTPTLWARTSRRLTFLLSKSFASRKEGPRICAIGVSQV